LDGGSERFGLPSVYGVKIRGASGSSEKLVHWKRVIHVAEGLLENDWEGTPRLERVYNRLMDLEKTMAAAAEGFWRNAFPGLAAVKDPNYDWTAQTRENIEQQFFHYFHQLSRLLKLEGVDIKELTAQPADPEAHVNAFLRLCAAASRIPVRILTGSERGELASSQDETAWNARVDERRDTWASPSVVMPVVDRFIELGIVGDPKDRDSLFAGWPEREGSDKDQTEIALKRTEMLAKYASTPGIEAVMTPRDFMVRIMRLAPEDADAIAENAEAGIAAEDEESARLAAAVAAEAGEEEEQA